MQLSQVQGFPTLVWVDGKSGGTTVYEGDRSLEDLTRFVKGRGSKGGAAADEEDEDMDADLLLGEEVEEEGPAKDEL
jgi:hypothetical protein